MNTKLGKLVVLQIDARRVFTTGQVAKICQVAPATVSKWFDSGLLRGYRIPGSGDRRVPRANLEEFLEKFGMEQLVQNLGPVAAGEVVEDLGPLAGELVEEMGSAAADPGGQATGAW